MIRRPPRSTRADTLFPYTTLIRSNPARTDAVGGRGLVNGDTLTGALATVAAQSSIPGNYAITRGTLAASENYSLRFAPGVLTILNVEPVPSMLIASTLARDAFATIVDPLGGIDRSEERRGGKECVSTCRSRWWT